MSEARLLPIGSRLSVVFVVCSKRLDDFSIQIRFESGTGEYPLVVSGYRDKQCSYRTNANDLGEASRLSYPSNAKPREHLPIDMLGRVFTAEDADDLTFVVWSAYADRQKAANTAREAAGAYLDERIKAIRQRIENLYDIDFDSIDLDTQAEPFGKNKDQPFSL